MVRDGFQTISFSYIDSSFLQNLESAKKKKIMHFETVGRD